LAGQTSFLNKKGHQTEQVVVKQETLLAKL
jgi:hypothetical protein